MVNAGECDEVRVSVAPLGCTNRLWSPAPGPRQPPRLTLRHHRTAPATLEFLVTVSMRNIYREEVQCRWPAKTRRRHETGTRCVTTPRAIFEFP